MYCREQQSNLPPNTNQLSCSDQYRSLLFAANFWNLHLIFISFHSFIHSLHAFQYADQVRCSTHSMAALQPALSCHFLCHVNERPINCTSSLTFSTHCFWLLPLTLEASICPNGILLGSRSSGILAKWPSHLSPQWLTIFEILATLH